MWKQSNGGRQCQTELIMANQMFVLHAHRHRHLLVISLLKIFSTTMKYYHLHRGEMCGEMFFIVRRQSEEFFH